jgi:hypothetical protein
MTTFNRDQLSDWLHDFLPEEMRERPYDFEVTGTHEEQSLDYVTLVFAEKQKEEK